MGLEDFERELEEQKKQREREKEKDSRHHSHHRHHRHRHGDSRRDRDDEREENGRSSHRSHGHHRHHHSSRHGSSSTPGDKNGDRHRSRHKRSRDDNDDRENSTTKEQDPSGKRHRKEDTTQPTPHPVSSETTIHRIQPEDADRIGAEALTQPALKRDAWMEQPSALDIDYVNRPSTHQQRQELQEAGAQPRMLQSDFGAKLHDRELNRHLHDVGTVDEQGRDVGVSQSADRSAVDYTFGDAGAHWRMTKLRSVYRIAKETGREVDDVAMERYGDLRAFDDAREEETEIERREMYGEGYVGKDKPSGELYEQRKLDARVHRDRAAEREKEERKDEEHWDTMGDKVESLTQGQGMRQEPVKEPLDSTALNRLKAKMMKAKLRKAPDAQDLEEEYNAAMAASAETAFNQASSRNEPVVLGAMDFRMLADPKNEVKPILNKRGLERGNVTANEDMSVADMVREERRTRGGPGEGMRLAEMISKDTKFDNDLEYMDDNAEKLARRAPKSGQAIRNAAINEFHKVNRALDTCPLCYHEDTEQPPIAPVISLATRTYLTLPTEPELSDGGAVIVPLQHRTNLLECDDNEWEEIRNFMKAVTRMYHDQGRDVLFYENAANPGRRLHAAMSAVPIPYDLGQTAPAFFREAILAADEEWSQHKKLIDTLANARKAGYGRSAFRRSLAKEMPYFHVWFELDGGLGHVVEDPDQWPRGDLFAREIIGGMLDAPPDVIRKQGRWQKNDRRVEGFQRRWRKFDWTRVLEVNS